MGFWKWNYLQCKDMKKSNIKQKALAIFSSGNCYFAAELNSLVGFNDARKIISVLRRDGYLIKDKKVTDGRKLYWLEADERQLSFHF